MVGKTLRHPAPAPSASVGAGGIVWVDYANAVGIALWCLPVQYSVHRKNFYMSGLCVCLLQLPLLLALFLIKKETAFPLGVLVGLQAMFVCNQIVSVLKIFLNGVAAVA